MNVMIIKQKITQYQTGGESMSGHLIDVRFLMLGTITHIG